MPAGSEVWTALRIEAGLPVFGVDISDDNLAQEVGRTKTAISFTKGCYLGQEPIARLDALGHVNRELRSLRLTGGRRSRDGSSHFCRRGRFGGRRHDHFVGIFVCNEHAGRDGPASLECRRVRQAGLYRRESADRGHCVLVSRELM